jgi:hypothetical protein
MEAEESVTTSNNIMANVANVENEDNVPFISNVAANVYNMLARIGDEPEDEDEDMDDKSSEDGLAKSQFK